MTTVNTKRRGKSQSHKVMKSLYQVNLQKYMILGPDQTNSFSSFRFHLAINVAKYFLHTRVFLPFSPFSTTTFGNDDNDYDD